MFNNLRRTREKAVTLACETLQKRQGNDVAQALLDLAGHCEIHGIRVTHYRLTQANFDALLAFHNHDPIMRRDRIYNGYPIKVYP